MTPGSREMSLPAVGSLGPATPEASSPEGEPGTVSVFGMIDNCVSAPWDGLSADRLCLNVMILPQPATLQTRPASTTIFSHSDIENIHTLRQPLWRLGRDRRRTSQAHASTGGPAVRL